MNENTFPLKGSPSPAVGRANDSPERIYYEPPEEYPTGTRAHIWEQWQFTIARDIAACAEELDSLGDRLEPNFALELISRASQAWALVGLALKKIFRYNLWQGMGFSDKKSFCAQVLGRSVHYCGNMIRSSEVVFALTRAGFEALPRCHSHAIALFEFLGEEGSESYSPKCLAEKWREVLDAANRAGKNITTGFINSVLRPEKIKEQLSKITVKPEIWEIILRGAAEAGTSPDKWVEGLIRASAGADTEPTTEEQEEAWQGDLEDLVGELPEPLEVESSTENAQLSVVDREYYSTDRLFDRLQEGWISLEQLPAMSVMTEEGLKDLADAVLTRKIGQQGVNDRQHAINIYRKHGDYLAADIVEVMQQSEEIEQQQRSQTLLNWFDTIRSNHREITGLVDGHVYVSKTPSSDAVCIGEATELSELSPQEFRVKIDDAIGNGIEGQTSLFDIEKYSAPQPPAQLIEDGNDFSPELGEKPKALRPIAPEITRDEPESIPVKKRRRRNTLGTKYGMSSEWAPVMT